MPSWSPLSLIPTELSCYLPSSASPIQTYSLPHCYLHSHILKELREFKECSHFKLYKFLLLTEELSSLEMWSLQLQWNEYNWPLNKVGVRGTDPPSSKKIHIELLTPTSSPLLTRSLTDNKWSINTYCLSGVYIIYSDFLFLLHSFW